MKNHASVVTEIAEILKERFDISVDIDSKEDLTENLFGAKCRMTYYDLLYLLKIVESKYEVRFSDEDFDCPEFYCLDGLSGIITNAREISA